MNAVTATKARTIGSRSAPPATPQTVRPSARGKVAPKAMVNTKKVKRRALRFRSIADMEREVDRLVAGARAGRTRFAGNWDLAQMLGHLAAWVDYFYIGFPIPRAPWAVRMMVRIMKGRMLNGSLPQGMRLPNVKEGTYGADPISLDDALAKFRGSVGRLKTGEAPRHASPAFGPMTLDEVVKLTLRHAELHLGFADA